MRTHATLLRGLAVLFVLALVPLPAPAAAIRHSGTVVEVGRDSFVVDELGRAGREQKLRVTVTPKTRLVDAAERNPHASGAQDAFIEKTIALSDVKPGDFVVVETSQAGKRLVADVVIVTLRGGAK